MARTVTLDLKGGRQLNRKLGGIAQRLASGGAVKVGFLESARYVGTHGIRGTPRFEGPVAQVAFWNEFGTKRAPPRPAMRTWIADSSPTWAVLLGRYAIATKYDGPRTLALMGEKMQDQLTESIRGWTDPPNAARTVKIKGFNAPLRDEGIMLNSVAYEVSGV